MLKAVESRKSKAEGFRFAIIASKYNARYVDSMLRATRRTLLRAGAAEVKVVRVPGAFEIPVVASLLAQRADPFSTLICLGVILRGATTHANHIAEAISHALAQIQVQYQRPVIHEVLLLENEDQAKTRCLSPKHNRGVEAARTAIEMALVMKRFSDEQTAQMHSAKARLVLARAKARARR